MDWRDILSQLPIAQNFVRSGREQSMLEFEDAMRTKLMDRLKAGQPIGKHKKHLVFNETTGITEPFDPTKYGLDADTDVEFLKFKPAGSTNLSEAEVKRKEKLTNLIGALGEKLFVNPEGMETPINTRKDAIKLSLQMGFDPKDARIRKLIDAMPEQVEEAASGPTLGDRVKPVAEKVVSGVKKMFGKKMIRVKDSTGKIGEIPEASLEKAKKMDPGLQLVNP